MAEFEKLIIDDVEYTTTYTANYANRTKWVAPNANLLTAYIPGTIMQIDVKVGDAVEKGQELLILQAMKMNNKIVAPFAGKIKNIEVAVGDKVAKGALMIEMEA